MKLLRRTELYTLLAMIDASEVREEDENFKNAVDYMFEALEKEKPNHFAVKQYKKYNLQQEKLPINPYILWSKACSI
ncbi:Uncharacterised protein [Peptoniphilus harei]|uniref:Uncharacterized protein n=1 Tax=Peptoniphilus harei TaxID=54005 RepID=A0A2X1YVM3_9FIRM|nr:Uncharacterised protein [Peptoniphilus harei]